MVPQIAISIHAGVVGFELQALVLDFILSLLEQVIVKREVFADRKARSRQAEDVVPIQAFGHFVSERRGQDVDADAIGK